ncbi:E3 ubiquitin-protein ligase APD2 isoform X1 [Oryza brachyantha]|uniref:E3 ubiquitin-protein ligase APD2 isoform X1 n=1 Tax=Oryza brachyantha TaxID=4533 RepID=UPI000776957F|nr:E3 ubiquitin-protein ligase APD2 isoform X1 [Oryza brachyantha]
MHLPFQVLAMELLLVDLPFSPQLVSYFVMICVIVAVFYCFLKQLAEFSDTDQQTIRDQDARTNETEPILPRKRVVFCYGTTEEQPESSMISEDMCSEKVCKICYDAPRSCFFIPCGHGFACFTCAKRIAEDKNQTCPICRRLIHRVRRLVKSP